MHYNLMHWQVGCSDGSVLLFDIATLGEEAFSSGGLRMLIEDPAVIKLMYVRTYVRKLVIYMPFPPRGNWGAL